MRYIENFKKMAKNDSNKCLDEEQRKRWRQNNHLWSKVFLSVLLASCFSCGPEKITLKAGEAKNILVIISDDLRTELNVYGKAHMVTPNIDKLASEGITFKRAYVQQAVCSASRASFLTGVRPNSTGVDYPYSQYFVYEVLPNYETISSYFYNKGYYARNFGKIHHGGDFDSISAPHFDPFSKEKGAKKKYALPEHVQLINERGNQFRPAFEMAEVHDTMYQDGQTTMEVLKTLDQVKKHDKPFFLAVGFNKPHLPFNAPKKYWDLYNREDIQLAKNKYLPADAPKYSIRKSSLRGYAIDYFENDELISDSLAITLRHAYYACVSYVDAQVGAITQKLEELGLRENTIVVFMSDHGWHLGEQGMWGKWTNFENATLAPLIISIPNTANSGMVTKALTEYVDIFPTLIDASGLDSEIPSHLEGTSLLPVIENPSRPWKSAAFSQFPRAANAKHEGYSVRTDKYRYTEWWDNENDSLMSTELYDHSRDPMESMNVSGIKENAKLITDLHQVLELGWKSALPEGIINNSNNPRAPRSVAYSSWNKNKRKIKKEYFKKRKIEGKTPNLMYERY